MIELTREQWKKFAPNCPANYSDALLSNLDILRSSGILESEFRWCHFAGTVYEETGDFSEIRENLSYRTASVLRKTWPSRFGHREDASLAPLLRNPRALADAVYSGRMGNKPGTSDAYDFRGGGWFQTTGRAAVAEYCTKMGIEASPNTLDDPVLTLKFAVLEWHSTNCNAWADENDAVKIAKAINTGSAASNVKPVGMDDRKAAFARAWKIWGEAGQADVPAKPVSIGEIAAKVGAPAAAAGTVIGTLPTPPAAVTDAIASATAWSDLAHTVLAFGPWVIGAAIAAGAGWWIYKGRLQ